MDGGRIIGEGEDGCILSEPTWPCVGVSDQRFNTDDTNYISKMVKLSDNESDYIKVATRILGPEYSQYVINLKGDCTPANSLHPPKIQQREAFKKSIASVISWNTTDAACTTLKKNVLKGNSISSKYKVMYISKYPMTLDEWSHRSTIHIQYVNDAIPKFIYILQLLFQSSEQLINLDLHAGNIFVRPGNKLQFGLADFGRCLYRNTSSNTLFFGKYLCENTAIYDLFSNYHQIPLELRFLNYIYKKKLEHLSPGECIRVWLHDPLIVKQQDKHDAILYNHQTTIKLLLTKPLFIKMIETLQSISQKLRLFSTPYTVEQSLSLDEKVILEYCITRHDIISPINMISSVCSIVSQKADYSIEFIRRAILSPYIQVGSSLPDAVASVQRADMGIIWSDIVRGR